MNGRRPITELEINLVEEVGVGGRIKEGISSELCLLIPEI